MAYRKKSQKWVLRRFGHSIAGNETAHKGLKKTSSGKRITTSWEYVG
jgi:hypothetical protein